jgi:hypothetical protein
MLHYFVTLIAVMVMLILLVLRIGFGVTGVELVGVMPTVQGFVRCDVGSLWLVIMPKSMDRFWLSYCYCTCDLNILGTRMEASFPLSRNGV